MPRHRSRILLLVVLIVSLVLASCGSNSKKSTTPAKPNLIVESITSNPADPVQGQPVTVTVRVRNDGDAEAVTMRSEVKLDGTATCSQIEVPAIAPGAYQDVTCNLGMPALGNHLVEACADVTHAVDEAIETDNCIEKLLIVSANPSPVPSIQTPNLPSGPDFGSTDAHALGAEELATGLLAVPQEFFATASTFTLPLPNATWTAQGDCWTWGETSGGCDLLYDVCPDGLDLAWTLTMNGDCLGAGPPAQDWVAFNGSSSTDGTEGTLWHYAPNSEEVVDGWGWNIASDGRSGTWMFYQGAVSPVNFIGQLTYQDNTDGTLDLEWLLAEDNRWTMNTNADGTDGRMSTYVWGGGSAGWIIQNEMVWAADGHGHWYIYDETGTQVDEQYVW